MGLCIDRCITSVYETHAQTLYRMREKSLVKRVFNFGSVCQDLGVAN